MLEKLTGPAHVRGRVRAFHVGPFGHTGKLPGIWVPSTRWRHNLVLYDWAGIAAKLMVEGDRRYRISGMYLEFRNAAPPITPPAFDRAGGIDYYQGLADSADIDFLRVPLVAGYTSNSDSGLFAADNTMNLFAQTQGVVGVHGKAFSDAANSVIYGGGLVALVDQGDYTQDLVFSRFYFDADEQQEKLPSSQIGLQWELILD